MATPLTHYPLKQPDIAYQPDYEKYLERVKRRLETETLSKSLPDGFPSQIESPLVWKGSDLRNEDEWILKLNDSDLKEIDGALAYFKSLHIPIGHVCQETFPLKSLGQKLRSCAAEIHNGKGFSVIRNFPVETLDREACIIAYAGVSSYIGSLRGQQDRSGLALVHVTDLSATQKVGTATYTNEPQVFHTDNGDIVSLLALETAAQGGESKLASTLQVYNTIAKERPDLIRVMAEDWPFDSFGGEPAYYNRPLLFQTEEGRMIIQYFRRLFTGFGNLPRPTTIPPISEAQAEALDALQFYSSRESKLFAFKKGDIQYINNLSIFHAREGYLDSSTQRRHLLRLWLRDEEYGWQIPNTLQSGLGRTWDGLRHETKSDSQKFPLEAATKIEK